MNHQSRAGNLMIESLVAISMILIGLLGIFNLLSQTIGLNKDTGQKFVATYLAAEGIEVVRSIVDANYTAPTYPTSTSWNSGINDGDYEVSYDTASLGSNLGNGVLSTKPLTFDSPTGIYSYGNTAISTPYLRTVAITNISRFEIKVVSTVNWSDRGAAKSVSLEDHFFNWR